MSEEITALTRFENKKSVGMYVVDDVGANSASRAYKILAGFPKAADKAVEAAIKRAGASGEAQGARILSQKYYASVSTIKQYTKWHRHINTSGGNTTVEIQYNGTHIPLLKFDTKVTKDGRVSARVMRTSARTAIEHGFKQYVGEYGHEGIFERVSDDRTPIREFYGPSVPQMLASNEEVQQEMAEKVNETFEKRLEHEITAILNGWRE